MRFAILSQFRSGQRSVSPSRTRTLASMLLVLAWISLSLSTVDAYSWFSPASSTPNDDSRDFLVSPIVNREIETSVVAHGWAFTPHNVLCEAALGYYQSDWKAFLDKWVNYLDENTPGQSTSELTRQVLEVVADNPQDRKLLSYGLALRAYSPQCELHRGLARDLLLSPGANFIPANSTVDAFVHVILDDRDVLIFDVDQVIKTLSQGAAISSIDLVPGEVAWPALGQTSGDEGHPSRPAVVLYANMASRIFVDMYRALEAVSDEVSFAVRHIGNFLYEEIGGDVTVLQGYGVRLDIRNVEYRVFDDRGGGGETDEKSSMINVTSMNSTLENQFLAGVNASALMSDPRETLRLQAQLWKIHYAEQLLSERIPPKWQRRQLSLQAASAIMSSAENDATADPLVILQDVSQNLPSVASTLVHLDVSSPQLLELAGAMEELLPSGRGAMLFVNGRRLPIDRPSFNVFELFQLIKQEQKELKSLQDRLKVLPEPALKEIHTAWTGGEDALLANKGEEGAGTNTDHVVRIDVGRGWKQAVIYMNDVEKDAQYAAWPRQVQQMVFAMQFGVAPSVRRNIFTVLAILDPLDESSLENAALMLGSQLMQSSFPARLGVLFVSDEDLEACSAWASNNGITDDDIPCPVNPLFKSKVSKVDDLDAFLITTHALHRLFSHVCDEHTGDGVAPAYLQYLLQTIDQRRKQKGTTLTLKDLVLIHAQILSELGVSDEGKSTGEALQALSTSHEDDDSRPVYGKALRFALNKSILAGMGFVNGRPLPLASDVGGREKVGQVFSEEQSHIMQLIMEGEITDTSPKSVYAKLLTGDKVFKRLHPLLFDTANAETVFLQHGSGPNSLLFPKTMPISKTAEAIFVVDAFLDLGSTSGQELAKSFLSIMDAFPATIGDGDEKSSISLAYRILPSESSVMGQSLCGVFSNAALFGASSLVSLLDALPERPEIVIDTIPGISDDMRSSIQSGFDSCGKLPYFDGQMPSKNFVLANGRVFSFDNGNIGKGDVELLLAIELKRAKAVTTLLSQHLSYESPSHYDAVAQSAVFLAQSHQGSEKESRSDIRASVQRIEEDMRLESNPLHFSWNKKSEIGELRVEIAAIADPISETTQRLAPLLRALRDELGLPVTLVLAPRRSSNTNDNTPIASYYRFVADPSAVPDTNPPKAVFTNLPLNHVLTLQMDVPEPWNVQQSFAVQDTDNLRCDIQTGCSDATYAGEQRDIPISERRDLTRVEYGLQNLLIFGQCYDATNGSPPNGLQLTLSRQQQAPSSASAPSSQEIGADGSVVASSSESLSPTDRTPFSDTLVMKNVGYWQLRANPGIWDLTISSDSRGAEIFDMVKGKVVNRKLKVVGPAANNATKTIVMNDFVNHGELLVVKRRPGYEKASLFYKSKKESAKEQEAAEEEVINVFSLATGHLYERFLKIMMLSVTKRTSSKVKFWLFENFLSPTFKASAQAMAERIGCEVEFVTYKWPEWVRGQSEKQRIIWGYKILFLDVLFPLNVKKIIYVDADQVVRGDLKELWDMDLQGAPYGYTPFCTSRETTLGFQFWRSGFWKSHLGDRPYHISALYIVDLEKFRQDLVGDILRSTYQQLSADPNSLANLDQDLPNYAQSHVPIFSLPQEWLWCESWCSDETKATAKTIDLCNNPLHKEPKVSMAKRIISGELFNESWIELDAEQERYTQEYLAST